MTRFEIKLFIADKDETDTQQLNEEWSIRCERPLYYSRDGVIKFIRKKTDREDSVSGKLNFFYSPIFQNPAFEITFSEKLLRGYRDANIQCNNSLTNIILDGVQIFVQGYVNVTEISDQHVDGLQKEQSKKCTQSKSTVNKESKKRIPQKSLEKLLADFERLLDPKTSCFADVTLKCGDATIPAHKNILSARSPVFAAMFTNAMKESIKNEVDITDIDVPTVRALLIYMYTGKTDFNDSSATDLLFAADKYQLQELKRVCSDFLKDTVSPQNVLRILVLGDMIDEDLKSFAVDYICDKCAEFSALENTEEWETLQKEKPALSMEVLTSLVKSMNEKLKK